MSQKLNNENYDVSSDNEILNPVLDSGFFKELKIFLQMTNRDIKEEVKKIFQRLKEMPVFIGGDDSFQTYQCLGVMCGKRSK